MTIMNDFLVTQNAQKDRLSIGLPAFALTSSMKWTRKHSLATPNAQKDGLSTGLLAFASQIDHRYGH